MSRYVNVCFFMHSNNSCKLYHWTPCSFWRYCLYLPPKYKIYSLGRHDARKLFTLFFNVHEWVNRKNILIYIQQDVRLHSLFYLETALYVSGSTTTHHQELTQLYLQHLVFVTLFNSIHYSVTNTSYCRHSCLRSWWWVEVLPETCSAMFLNSRTAAWYRALASIIPGRERFPWKLLFQFSKHFSLINIL